MHSLDDIFERELGDYYYSPLSRMYFSSCLLSSVREMLKSTTPNFATIVFLLAMTSQSLEPWTMAHHDTSMDIELLNQQEKDFLESKAKDHAQDWIQYHADDYEKSTTMKHSPSTSPSCPESPPSGRIGKTDA